MFVSLSIPAGMFRNGTDLQAAGRWRDGSLVRWRDGIMQPVGGWRERSEVSLTSTPCGAIVWQDNSNDRWIAVASHDELYVMTAANVASDITPAGLTAGTEIAAANTGFGGGFFGSGFYGDPREDYGNYAEATSWSLSTWGEYLIACSVSDGKIYEWQLDTGVVAAAVSNAPTDCVGAIVTEERFLFALGAGGNPRKVQWSDREDNTTWTPASTNEAGDFELSTDGQIMGAVSTRGQTLIVTDSDAHVANYIGPPFVYGFERVGSACGTISRRAIVSYEGGAMWMGARSFFAYGGGDAKRVPCEVSDYVFGDINSAQYSLVHGVLNAQFGEIWWFYPSGGSTTCDRYVTFNYMAGHWQTGEMQRSAAVDRGVFSQPIWFDEDGVAYDHEVGTNYDGERAYIETGPISLGNGDNVMMVTQLIPDEVTQGEVQVELKSRFYPNSDESTFGPYTMSAPTDVRLTGRQVRMKVQSTGGESWRWGVPRLNVKARGGR